MKKIKISILLFIAFFATSCTNLYQKAFVPDLSVSHYKADVIKKSKNPEVYYLRNPELETIGIIENGYLYLGYSNFENEEFDDEKQAIDFAKKIGASLVLIHKKFERKKKVYDDVSTVYPVSTYPVVVDNKTVYSSGYQPTIQYSVQFDDKGKKTKEKITTNIPVVPPVYVFEDKLKKPLKPGKNPVKNIISTNTALQIWQTPIEQRNYFAVPNGQSAVVIPNGKQEREVEINSYYASFWAKTNYPPALGVHVADLDTETKQKLGITNGVNVWAVTKNSPASKVPIYRGDILLSINDEPIIDSDLQMGSLIRKYVGKTVKIEILRNGKKIYKNIKLNKTTF